MLEFKPYTMKFALALLATTAAALELPSTFDYAAWTTNHFFSREAPAKNFNRLRFRASTPIFDMNGYAAGTPDTFTTSNMAWYGGCQLRPGKLYEDYMNFSVDGTVAGPTAQYPDVTGVTRKFRNKKLSGSVQYVCRDSDGVDTLPTVDCAVSGSVTGFHWDSLTAIGQATGVGIYLHLPRVESTGPAPLVAAHPWLYGLDDNCLP